MCHVILALLLLFFPLQSLINFSEQHFIETNEQYHIEVGGKLFPADLTAAVAV